MSIDQSLLLIIQKLTNINVAESFTSMCFESKKWVSSTLVPCILELHLELRRFGSMGKSWNTKYRGPALLLCRTYATIAYVRDNAVCRMPYEICRTGVRILSSSKQTLPLDIWLNIKSMGIQSNQRVTHRGVRGGVRKQRHCVSISSHDNIPASSPSALGTPTQTTPESSNKDQDHLTIGLWNSQSVGNKTTTCVDYVLEKRTDALFLTETWLTDSDNVIIGELCPPHYSFINIPRGDGTDKHGGIGVLYRSHLKLQIVPSDFNSVTFEYAIISNTQRKTYFVPVYRPPPSRVNGLKTSQFMTEFDSFLEYVSSFACGAILLGDFNIHVNKPHKSETRQFQDIVQSAGFN